MPAADGPVVETAVCMYTNTPDENFLIDRHPAHARVILASPCSGHGFKFSSAIGEQLALLATDARLPFDLSPFRLDRFAR
jgi:sarcosine oxidase